MHRLVFKELTLSIIQNITYQGIHTQTKLKQVLIGQRSLNSEFEFADFEVVEGQWSQTLINKVKQEHLHLTESDKAYMLELPQELLSIELTTEAQSFDAPNIQCDLVLKIDFVISTSEESPNLTTLSCQCPILLLPSRNRRTHDVLNPPPMPPTTVVEHTEEQLPSYNEVV